MTKTIALLFLVISIISCSVSNENKKENTINKTTLVPIFNADSAYAFVQKQVDFGPRIPNTIAHKQAGDYIIEKLKKCKFNVNIQSFKASTYDGVSLQLRNIMASSNPSSKKRILLATHWDTRPWASKDLLTPKAQFDGANDGASGVGVLLEIARVLYTNKKPNVGVDLLFFDGEDWGQENGGSPDTWCLGSQYWAKNKGNYIAYYGILLDMVGGEGAQFPFEGYSYKMAKKVVTKVWKNASEIGHSKYFVARKEGAITDDHYYVNVIGKIPMINILHYDPINGYFGDFHHTTKDNMSNINKNTLEAVGETILYTLYKE